MFSLTTEALSSWGALVLLFGSLGCNPSLPPPPVPEEDPNRAWGARLDDVVSHGGQVDFAELRRDHAALDAFVGWIAVHGPETDNMRMTDDDRRLAWHLNAINALMIWAELQGLDAHPPQLFSLRFRVDGEPVQLGRYLVNGILATYEEPLAVAGIGCNSPACPPMATTLYTRAKIDAALELRMQRWAESGRLVREVQGEWVFSPLLAMAEKGFARWADAPTLCAAVAEYVDPALAERLMADPECPHRVGGW